MPKRPCTCDRYQQGQPYEPGRDCRLCWIYAHHPKFRALWGGAPLAQEDPGLLERSLDFMRSLTRHVRAGCPQVSDEVLAQRLALCRTCEFFHNDRCGQCGCHLVGAVFAKARWQHEQCPIGKW